MGLWPARQSETTDADSTLNVSRLFVDRLLATGVAGLTPLQRIETLNLLSPSEEQITALERFLRSAASKPLLLALAELADKPNLWVNVLQIESAAE